MQLLVTGGAGYIGSHAADLFGRCGYEVTVLDNLSTGYQALVPKGQLCVGDLDNTQQLETLFQQNSFNAVVHFAASVSVEESIERPDYYYQNNVCNTLNLLRCCVRHKVRQFIFSSTAAVYGAPDAVPISEDCPVLPINPYGHSKLSAERMLQDVAVRHGIRYVILRYYNVAGADADLRRGEMRLGAKHLITAACRAALGITQGIEIYGTDYPTPDGTCVRDFIHVTDIADVHVKALQYLDGGGASVTLNCGYGKGFSVREVLKVVKEVSAADFPVRSVARRKLGIDPPILVADGARLVKVLCWQPVFYDIHAIVESAWKWHKAKHC